MYEVLTNSAVSLVELAREAAPVYGVVIALAHGSVGMHQAGHPGVMSLHVSCSGDSV